MNNKNSRQYVQGVSTDKVENRNDFFLYRYKKITVEKIIKFLEKTLLDTLSRKNNNS
jgi:hypothetical protein